MLSIGGFTMERIRIFIMAVVLFAFVGCMEPVAWVTLEEAAEAHKYDLAVWYNEPVDDIVWQIRAHLSGKECKPDSWQGSGFCYEYCGVNYIIGDTSGAHMDFIDYFYVKKDDASGWKYADWL
jgi:hypothetical protein